MTARDTGMRRVLLSTVTLPHPRISASVSKLSLVLRLEILVMCLLARSCATSVCCTKLYTLYHPRFRGHAFRPLFTRVGGTKAFIFSRGIYCLTGLRFAPMSSYSKRVEGLVAHHVLAAD